MSIRQIYVDNAVIGRHQDRKLEKNKIRTETPILIRRFVSNIERRIINNEAVPHPQKLKVFKYRDTLGTSTQNKLCNEAKSQIDVELTRMGFANSNAIMDKEGCRLEIII